MCRSSGYDNAAVMTLYATVKVLSDKFDGVVAAIKQLCDQQENLDTKSASQNLMRTVWKFTFY